MKILKVEPSKCIGCKTCELACSFEYAKNGTLTNNARIDVHKTSETAFIPMLCLQCVDAACVAVCPTSSLSRNVKTGAIEFDYEKCVKCNACLFACPFGNIKYDKTAQKLVKCDLCKGDPKCAIFCPTKTLVYKKDSADD